MCRIGRETARRCAAVVALPDRGPSSGAVLDLGRLRGVRTLVDDRKRDGRRATPQRMRTTLRCPTTCGAQPRCGSSTWAIRRLLVVLDRSGSMTVAPTTFPPVFDHDVEHEAALNQIAAAKDITSSSVCSSSRATRTAPLTRLRGRRSRSTRTPRSRPTSRLARRAATRPRTSRSASRADVLPVDPGQHGRPLRPVRDRRPAELQRRRSETTASDAADRRRGHRACQRGHHRPTCSASARSVSPTGVLNDAATAGGKAKPGNDEVLRGEQRGDLDCRAAGDRGGIIVPSCSYRLAERAAGSRTT